MAPLIWDLSFPLFSMLCFSMSCCMPSLLAICGCCMVSRKGLSCRRVRLEQARQALGRGQGNLDPHGILSVESLMDEIIDRAYDEDDEMGVSIVERIMTSMAVWPCPCLLIASV